MWGYFGYLILGLGLGLVLLTYFVPRPGKGNTYILLEVSKPCEEMIRKLADNHANGDTAKIMSRSLALYAYGKGAEAKGGVLVLKLHGQEFPIPLEE